MVSSGGGKSDVGCNGRPQLFLRVLHTAGALVGRFPQGAVRPRPMQTCQARQVLQSRATLPGGDVTKPVRAWSTACKVVSNGRCR